MGGLGAVREIKFRGKRVDNGEWVYGSLIVDGEKRFISHIGIVPINGNETYYQKRIDVEVIPETVGQYTGMKDKKGNKVFGGDIARWISSRCEILEGAIRYVDHSGGFRFFPNSKKNVRYEASIIFSQTMHSDAGEVIGTIHDKDNS